MARFAEMDDIGGTFSSLGLFIVTVVLGTGVHGLLVLPLLFFIITRSNPYKFLSGMTAAMTTAFGTDSRFVICGIFSSFCSTYVRLEFQISRKLLLVCCCKAFILPP